MKKFFAIIILTAASSVAMSQTPSPASAVPPKPPAPVLSADVTDSHLRSIFDAGREAMIGLRYDEALRLADEGIAAAPGIITGRAISKPAPPYPAIAKLARARGSVAVHLVVDEQGKVISARATSGHPLLRAVAVEAAKE